MMETYIHQLSRVERMVLYQLVSGEPNKCIAIKLGCAEATVKTHVKSILRKLRVRNRTQAAIWADRETRKHSGHRCRIKIQ